MVLIDGKLCKSCVQELKTSRVLIVTVEGLSARERMSTHIHSLCLARSSADFALLNGDRAKALLDREKDPTRKDVKNAIKTTYAAVPVKDRGRRPSAERCSGGPPCAERSLHRKRVRMSCDGCCCKVLESSSMLRISK